MTTTINGLVILLILPDAIASRIIRNEVVPRFRDGNFEGGIRAGVAAILSAVQGTYAPPNRAAETSVDLSDIALGLAGVLGFGLACLLLILRASGGNRKLMWLFVLFFVPFQCWGGSMVADGITPGPTFDVRGVLLWIGAHLLGGWWVLRHSRAPAWVQRIQQGETVRFGPLYVTPDETRLGPLRSTKKGILLGSYMLIDGTSRARSVPSSSSGYSSSSSSSFSGGDGSFSGGGASGSW